jgi:hypothetical protein
MPGHAQTNGSRHSYMSIRQRHLSCVGRSAMTPRGDRRQDLASARRLHCMRCLNEVIQVTRFPVGIRPDSVNILLRLRLPGFQSTRRKSLTTGAHHSDNILMLRKLVEPETDTSPSLDSTPPGFRGCLIDTMSLPDNALWLSPRSHGKVSSFDDRGLETCPSRLVCFGRHKSGLRPCGSWRRSTWVIPDRHPDRISNSTLWGSPCSPSHRPRVGISRRP